MQKHSDITISIAGSGNVASFLAVELYQKGFVIRQIYSRTLGNAKLLAKQVNAEATDHVAGIETDISLLIVALPDRIIAEFAKALSELHPDCSLKVAYTAGSVSLSEISPYLRNCGVLYPLQSITLLRKPDPKNIPFCIEGTNDLITDFLTKIAGTMSKDVRLIDSDQRRTIHLAAVFACNFSNHMMAIAEDILSKENVDFNILRPLIHETITRLETQRPKAMQTGPAARDDQETIRKHLEMLKDKAEVQQLYALITENIIRMKNLKGNRPYAKL